MAYWKPGSSKPDTSRGAEPSDGLDALQDIMSVTYDEKGSYTVVYNPCRHLPLQQQRKQLPIYAYYREFLWAAQISKVTIVIGETGTGKSTQLPQYLKEAGWTSNERLIYISVPMRIAAVTLATRVAEELGTPLGEEVGYCTSEETCVTGRCPIRYLTDRALLQLIQSDPLLLQAVVVILDDCHQRRHETDLLLGLLKKVQQKRPYLRLIVASATIDTELFVNFFHSSPSKLAGGHHISEDKRIPQRTSRWDTLDNTNRTSEQKPQSKNDLSNLVPETLRDVSILRVSGRLYPISYKYLKKPCRDYISAAYKAVLDIHRSSRDLGTILVFLCGKDDVDTLVERLNDITDSDAQQLQATSRRYGELEVSPLYGALPANAQLNAFKRSTPGRRKVVVATNIAESTVTIDRVGYVVDCGLAKISCYDPSSRADALCIVPISVASAQQRAGRAGRTQPGVCYRLYTQDFYKSSMQPCSIPELLRVNLAAIVLYLLSLGVNNFVTQMDLPTPVSSEALISALKDLYALEAIDQLGRLTEPFGQRMAELLPLDPMTSRFVLYSARETVGCLNEALIIASMLQCGSPWIVPPAKSRLKKGILEACMRSIGVQEGDLITLYNVYKQAEFYQQEDAQWAPRHMINMKAVLRAQRLHKRLEKRLAFWGLKPMSAGHDVTTLQKAICAGYFLHAASRQRDGSYRLCCQPDRQTHETLPSLSLHPLSLTFPRQPLFVVYHHAVMTSSMSLSTTHMISVTPIEFEWLPEVASHYVKCHFAPSA